MRIIGGAKITGLRTALYGLLDKDHLKTHIRQFRPVQVSYNIRFVRNIQVPDEICRNRYESDAVVALDTSDDLYTNRYSQP